MNEGEVRELENVLTLTLSDDNKARAEAERNLYKFLDTNREGLVFGLVKLARTSTNVHTRSLSAVFLRQNLPKGEPDLFSKLPDQLQDLVKKELLQAIISEPNESVRNLVGDLVAEIAKPLLYTVNGWPDLLPFLYSACASDNPVAKCSALLLWGRLTEHCPDKLQPEVANIGQCYAKTIKDANLEVRARTAIALCKTISYTVRTADTKSFLPFLPEILTTLSALLPKNELLGKKVVAALVELCAEESKFFRTHLEQFSQAMAAIGTSEQLEDGIRQLALECLVTITEKAEVMVRKSQSHFLRNTFGLAMSMMVSDTTDESWCKETTVPDLFDGTNFDAGETALDRLAVALGGDHIMTLVFPLITQFIGKPESRFRHAGLRALGQVGEVVPFKKLPIKQAVTFLRDGNARVRYAAMVCIGQLCVDHQPQIQKKYATDIIPALMNNLLEFEFPRLQFYAGAALFNFLDRAKAKQVDPYVEPMLNNLVQMLQRGVTIVQEQAATTMSGIAGAAKVKFSQFYPRIAPMLKQVIVNAKGKELANLRSKCIESLSFMGMRVGAELFYKDAEFLMSLFTQWKREGIAEDDTSIQYMLQACTRICTVLGEKFAPALSFVMPDVFALAKKTADWRIVKDVRDTADDDDLTPVGVRMHNMGFTSQMEEKASGCSMICSFAHDMKEMFFPYVTEAAQIMLPLMDFVQSDDVRSYAISSTAELFKVAMEAYKKKMCDEKFVQGLFIESARKTISCFAAERDLEMILTLVGVIKELVRLSGDLATRILDNVALQEIGKALLKLLTASHERIERRAKAKETEEEMDEQMLAKYEEQDQAEDQLNFHVQEAIAVLIKEFKKDFLPTFEAVAPEVLRMLDPKSLPSTRKIATYVWDDIVEHTGPLSAPFFPQFVPAMLQALHTPHAALRQGASFGFCVMAQYGGPAFAPYVDESLKHLIQALQECRRPEPESKQLQNWRWTITNRQYASPSDNIVSALGRICLYQNRPEVAPLFLQGLPLWIDDDEAEAVYSIVCTLVENNHPTFMGQNMTNLPRIVGILLDILGTQFCNEKVEPRVIAIIKKLQSMPPAALEGITRALSDEQKDDLRKVFAGETLDRPIPELPHSDDDEDGDPYWAEEEEEDA